jgi:hypothetical protein
MSRTLFENSKAALAFAALTIVGAVAMVGTPQDDGMLPKIADRFGKKSDSAQAAPTPASEAPPAAAPEKGPVEGWYDPPKTVFGDYKGTDPDAAAAPSVPAQGQPAPFNSAAAPAAGTGANANSQGNVNVMKAPLSPTAVIVN